MPAACTGLVGLKPTYGRVSRFGAMPLSPSLDHIGVLTRTARDTAILLGVLAGADDRDPLSSRHPVADYESELDLSLSGVRIGYVDDTDEVDLADEVIARLAESRRVLADLGAELLPVTLPPLAPLNALRRCLMFCEAASRHHDYLASSRDAYNNETLARLEPGLAVDAVTYLRAASYRAAALRRFVGGTMDGIDMLHLPALSQPVPRIDETDTGGDPRFVKLSNELGHFIYPFNYLGLPAISVPIEHTANGLPMGMQLVARPFAEALLLRAAHQVDRATGYSARKPRALSTGRASARPAGDTGKAIALILLAMLLMTCMDVLSKQLVPRLGAFEVAFLRYLISIPVAVVYAVLEAGGMPDRPRRPGLQLLRCAIITTELTLAVAAFGLMPLADAHAIFAATPLVITALAVPLLGERVGWRRWLAVVAGFLGVLIVLRPGAVGIDPGFVMVLVATLLFALFQILTRIVTRHDGVGLTFLIQVAVGSLLLVVPALYGWVWPQGDDWWRLVGTAALGSGSHLLLIKAYALAPASTLQPFGYTQFLWAILLGLLVFGDWPDPLTLLGAAVIVAAGLLAWRRASREGG